jgi:hypothetical protein
LALGANDGLLAKFVSVLVRPDDYLAHVRPAADPRGAEQAAAQMPAFFDAPRVVAAQRLSPRLPIAIPADKAQP